MSAPIYVFEPMDDGGACKIFARRYDPPYDSYDATSDPDDLEKLLDPRRREGSYFSAFDEGASSLDFSASAPRPGCQARTTPTAAR